jgi:hypothetical protein
MNPGPVDTFYSGGMWGKGASSVANVVVNYRYADAGTR